MPLYEYRCPTCGITEKAHAMGTAPSIDRCATCGDEARRMISAPMLKQVPKQHDLAIGRAEKSREAPEVVRRDPSTQRISDRSVNPKLERLVGKEAARQLRTAPHPANPAHRAHRH